MANEEHLKILEQGIDVWNKWREDNPKIVPDFSYANLIGMNFIDYNINESNLKMASRVLRKAKVHNKNEDFIFCTADLSKANLKGAKLFEGNLWGVDLSQANLIGAKFTETDFVEANLHSANLSEADLSGSKFVHSNLINADLTMANLNNSIFRGAILINCKLTMADLSNADLFRANLSKANLENAILRNSNLREADFTGADLNNSDLQHSHLIETNFNNANLENCSVYGISAWKINLSCTNQSNLIITPFHENRITVDNLEVAQFIYLLLHNEKIRNVIDTITSKVVLILGRFTTERKAILDAIREELRKRNYLPVLFDFDGPTSRDITETISTLAHLARFIIADITDAKSIPQELRAIVPNLPSIAVQPLLLYGKDEYGTFEHFKRYPWVLPIYSYKRLDDLLETLEEKVIAPAEAKVLEIRKQKVF